MSEITTQPWFWPAVIVSVGLPLVLIGLTEFANMLQRSGSRAAPIVLMVRNYLVPVAGVLVLLSQPGAWEGSGTWPKVIWTIFGLLVIVVTINAVNHLVFHRAEKGSWRDRFPTIFSDLIRFVFIIVGIALVFWWVWDADVAGVFAALGITSIVVGLALQNAVGSIVSGLFLIFEAPFQLGDWIDTGSVRGQIIEVNWRAIHLDTGNGIVVMPTAELAEGSFTNLSRAVEPYSATKEASVRDRRSARCGCARCSSRSRARSRSSHPTVSPPSPRRGERSTASRSRCSRRGMRERCSTRSRPGSGTPRGAPICIWTATSPTTGTATSACCAALRQVSPALSLHPADAEALATTARLERYAQGEVILRPGTVPRATRFILSGRVMLGVPTDSGFVQITELSRDDASG